MNWLMWIDQYELTNISCPIWTNQYELWIDQYKLTIWIDQYDWPIWIDQYELINKNWPIQFTVENIVVIVLGSE